MTKSSKRRIGRKGKGNVSVSDLTDFRKRLGAIEDELRRTYEMISTLMDQRPWRPWPDALHDDPVVIRALRYVREAKK